MLKVGNCELGGVYTDPEDVAVTYSFIEATYVIVCIFQSSKDIVMPTQMKAVVLAMVSKSGQRFVHPSTVFLHFGQLAGHLISLLGYGQKVPGRFLVKLEEPHGQISPVEISLRTRPRKLSKNHRTHISNKR